MSSWLSRYQVTPEAHAASPHRTTPTPIRVRRLIAMTDRSETPVRGRRPAREWEDATTLMKAVSENQLHQTPLGLRKVEDGRREPFWRPVAHCSVVRNPNNDLRVRLDAA